MKKSIIRKYIDQPTNVYHIVDEKYIRTFSESHRAFMLMYYYKAYSSFCENKGIKQLSIETFLINAQRRKIKLIQIVET